MNDGFRPDTVRPATMKVIAEAAGVGLGTVSRALSGSPHVAEETRRRVERAAKQLGYRPSAVGRGLKRQRTDTIGLIVADISNQFYGEFAQGVLAAAHEADRRVVVGSSGEHHESEHENLELLMQQRVDGIIAFPAGENLESWRAAQSLGIRVVFADRTVEGLDVPSVVVDNEKGMRRLTEHLIGLGHRRIGYLGGPRSVSSGLQRENGFRRALAAAGLSIDEDLIVSQSYTRESTRAGAARVLGLPARPTALIASNNVLAEAALVEIRERGIDIPGEISFAMVDDVPWASLTHPTVTVLAQPVRELGRAAVALLLDVTRHSGVELETEVIVRESTRPPAPLPDN